VPQKKLRGFGLFSSSSLSEVRTKPPHSEMHPIGPARAPRRRPRAGALNLLAEQSERERPGGRATMVFALVMVNALFFLVDKFSPVDMRGAPRPPARAARAAVQLRDACMI